MIVQVDGRLRGRLVVPTDLADEQRLTEMAMADPVIRAHVEGRQLRRSIGCARKDLELGHEPMSAIVRTQLRRRSPTVAGLLTRGRGSGVNLGVMALVTTLALGTMASCGYSLVGRGSFVPEYIRVVAIPTFTNNTARFELGVRVTDAVTREFVSRGNFRLVGDESGADAVLRGEIRAFNVNPIGIDRAQNADNWQVTISGARHLHGHGSEPRSVHQQRLPVSAHVRVPTGVGDIVDIEAGSIDEIAEEFARSVVSSILEGF